MNITSIPPFGTLVTSALAVCIALFSLFLARKNYHRDLAKWEKEYFGDMLKWADETMLVLAEAWHLCELDPARMAAGKFFETKHALKVRLSAQIDRGRWFFPNDRNEEFGLHKVEASRGHRKMVLEALVRTYRAVAKLNHLQRVGNDSLATEIESAKRLFASEIQQALNPRGRHAQFQKMMGRVSKS